MFQREFCYGEAIEYCGSGDVCCTRRVEFRLKGAVSMNKKRLKFAFIAAFVSSVIAGFLISNISGTKFFSQEFSIPSISGTMIVDSYDSCSGRKRHLDDLLFAKYRCYSSNRAFNFITPDSVSFITLTTGDGNGKTGKFALFERNEGRFEFVSDKNGVCKKYKGVVECKEQTKYLSFGNNKITLTLPRNEMLKEQFQLSRTFRLDAFSFDGKKLATEEYRVSPVDNAFRESIKNKSAVAKVFVGLAMIAFIVVVFELLRFLIGKAKLTKAMVAKKASNHAKKREDARMATVAKEEAVRAQVRDGMYSDSKAKEEIMRQIQDALDNDDTELAKSLNKVLKALD